MHRYIRYGFIEDLDTVHHIPIARVGGVSVSITPLSWLFPFVFFLFRIIQDSVGSTLTLEARFWDASVFTVGVAIFTLVHACGHLLAGTLVGSPMDELLFTATRGVNIYRGDQALVPSRVHLGRAVGGPLLNLVFAALMYALLPLIGTGFVQDVIASTASTNLFAGVASFLPLPSIDGQVIWREVLRPRNLQSPSRF